MAEYNWPYPDEFGQTETVDSDILVLGGGLAGCFAAIAAARKGKKVVLVEKGAPREAERQEQDLTTGNPPVRTRVLR